MPFKIIFLTVLIFLTIGCAPSISKKLYFASNIQIGDIQGDGSDFLTNSLKNKQKVDKAFNQNNILILTGTSNLSYEIYDENEDVLVMKAVKVIEQEVEDPFIKKIYKVKVPVYEASIDNFNPKRLKATFTFNWTLKNLNEIVASGQEKLNYEKSYGGYISKYGQGQLRITGQNLKKDLNEMSNLMSYVMIRNLGRGELYKEIETNNDEFSKKALTFARRGQWNEAEKIWKHILTLNPDFAPAYYNLGLYEEKSGNFQSALDYYKTAFLKRATNKHREAYSRLKALIEMTESHQSN